LKFDLPPLTCPWSMSKSSPASPLHAARRSIEAKAQALRRTMSTEQLAKRAKEVRDLFKMPMYIRIIDRMYATGRAVAYSPL
jgi:hypothetical protein